MTPKTLCDLVIKALEDTKGIDIVTIDVHTCTTITDFMVICSGTSNRHVNALAQQVVSKAKEQGIKKINMESDTGNEWVLVDLGDVVAHVMLPSTRALYNLEDFWNPINKMRNRQHCI